METDASSVIYLSHSLGSRALESRGQINVKSLKSGSVNIQQDSSYDWKDYRVMQLKIYFALIYGNFYGILQEAAEANDFYHLEALVKYNGIERTFLTSTKAVGICINFI